MREGTVGRLHAELMAETAGLQAGLSAAGQVLTRKACGAFGLQCAAVTPCPMAAEEYCRLPAHKAIDVAYLFVL